MPAAGVTYIMVSLGPNRQTDWEWTNWGAGLRALKTPAKAGVNGNGGCFLQYQQWITIQWRYYLIECNDLPIKSFKP